MTRHQSEGKPTRIDSSENGGVFLSIGEKKFRGAQLIKWIHQRGVTDFDQMTNLSKTRERLKKSRRSGPYSFFQGGLGMELRSGSWKWMAVPR